MQNDYQIRKYINEYNENKIEKQILSVAKRKLHIKLQQMEMKLFKTYTTLPKIIVYLQLAELMRISEATLARETHRTIREKSYSI